MLSTDIERKNVTRNTVKMVRSGHISSHFFLQVAKMNRQWADEAERFLSTLQREQKGEVHAHEILSPNEYRPNRENLTFILAQKLLTESCFLPKSSSQVCSNGIRSEWTGRMDV